MSDETHPIAFSKPCPDCIDAPNGWQFCDAHLALLHRERDEGRPGVSSASAALREPESGYWTSEKLDQLEEDVISALGGEEAGDIVRVMAIFKKFKKESVMGDENHRGRCPIHFLQLPCPRCPIFECERCGAPMAAMLPHKCPNSRFQPIGDL